MTGKQHDAAGLDDAAASDGLHGNAGTAPASTADDVPGRAAHDATAAAAAMGDECQCHDGALSR